MNACTYVHACGGADVRLLCVLAETAGAEQPSRSGVGAVCPAERSHLQAQQNLVGESEDGPPRTPPARLLDLHCALEHLHIHTHADGGGSGGRGLLRTGSLELSSSVQRLTAATNVCEWMCRSAVLFPPPLQYSST